MIRPILKKTAYELYKERKPKISHLRTFGCPCFIHNNGKRDIGKLDPKSDEGSFMGYTSKPKKYRVFFNKRSLYKFNKCLQGRDRLICNNFLIVGI